MKIHIAPYAIDLISGEITQDDECLIRLGGAETRLLTALVEANGDPVSRQALLEHGWPGKVVGPNSLNVAIANLRRSLPPPLQLITLPKFGYRIEGFVHDGELPLPEQLPPQLRQHVSRLMERVRQLPDQHYADHLAALAGLHEALTIIIEEGEPEDYQRYCDTIAELFNPQPDLSVLARGISQLTLEALEHKLGKQ